MLQIFSTAVRLVRSLGATAANAGAECERWLRDPLAHPVLAAMSATELADLPAPALRACCRE